MSLKDKVAFAVYHKKWRDSLPPSRKKKIYQASRKWVTSPAGKASVKKTLTGYRQTLKGRINNIKGGASQRGLKYELTSEYTSLFWNAPCAYCGAEVKGLKLDRVDNSLGYIEGNVESCCYECNKGKGTDSKEVYVARCKRVARRYDNV